MAQLLEAFPDDLRVVYRYYPLTTIHDKAFLAASAAEAAGLQDKFFEMKDLLFATATDTWLNMTPEEFENWLGESATSLGMNTAQFITDLTSTKIKTRVQNAYNEAASIGVPGTPFVLINGQPYQAARDFTSLSIIIKLTAFQDEQFTACPPMTIDVTARYLATIETNKGDIVIELYPEAAPMAVNNFIFLANEDWFVNNPFHRVLDGQLAQSGDPTGTGYGIPGYIFGNEISDLKYDKEGVVGMASAGPDSNGSQFFITMTPLPQLDGKYTIFGQVIQGMDVVKELTVRDPSTSVVLPDPDVILSVTVVKQ